jgi:hypothetical protein
LFVELVPNLDHGSLPSFNRDWQAGWRGPGLSVCPNSVYYLVQDVALTAILTHLRSDRGPKPSALQLAIVVCLVLLMLTGLVHTADAHSTTSDTARCPLCIVMHSVAPFVVIAAAVVLIKIGTPVPKPLEVRTIVRYWHPTLFTRPPPAGC